ncbi:MAG: prepilin-type N-terminal cleavage/methylation domain-containing protein [Candidatus Omnitrophota bacterium]
MRNRKGFTLVELMVVAVIVAILASVAIPMMRGNTERAIATECEAALGSIRSAMRVLYAEKSAYNTSGLEVDPTIVSGGVAGDDDNVPGFKARNGDIPGDLDGTYFSEDCYTITNLEAHDFEVSCDWTKSVSSGSESQITPKAADVSSISKVTKIDSYGRITTE